MFITKIISIYKHFDFFNIRKMMFEMQEFVKHNKTENCELPKTYYTFCNLRLFKPDYKFDSNASNRRVAKQLSNYELSMLKDISFNNSNMALKYAYVLQQPVPELESIIAQKSDTAALYACDILSK